MKNNLLSIDLDNYQLVTKMYSAINITNANSRIVVTYHINKMDNENMEKLHKNLTFSGAVCIIIGVVILAYGIACGVLSIISGGKLLSSRSKLLF